MRQGLSHCSEEAGEAFLVNPLRGEHAVMVQWACCSLRVDSGFLVSWAVAVLE